MRISPFAKRFIALSLCAGLVLSGTGGTTASQVDADGLQTAVAIGTDSGTGADTKSGADSGADANADAQNPSAAKEALTGADSGTGADTKPDADAGTGANADAQNPSAAKEALTGADAGTGTDTKPEADTGSEEDTEPKADAGSEEDTEPEEENESGEELQPLVYEDENVRVTVSAGEGVISEGTWLRVVPIVENADSDENVQTYDDVSAELMKDAEEKEYQLLGFLAYDISFVDDAGGEVEPDGDVTVSMEYVSPVLPESVENASDVADADVTVMHLKEDKNGAIENVVDLSADEKIETLTTTDANEIQKAEFVSDQFSPFTIVWTTKSNNNFINFFSETFAHLTVYYVDENGEELAGKKSGQEISAYHYPQDDNASGETTIIFENYADDVPGYTYEGAYYKDGNTETKVEKVTASSTGSYTWGTRKYYLTFDNYAPIQVTSSTYLKVYLVYTPTVGNMIVSKTAEGVSGDLSYTFTLKNAGTDAAVSGATYTIYDGSDSTSETGSTGSDGTFTLKNGQRAVFSSLRIGTYTVKETGVSDSSYSLANFNTYVTYTADDSGTTANEKTENSTSATVAVSKGTAATVHFVNDFKSTGSAETGTSASVDKSITVEKHTNTDNKWDGTYDLTFTVSGKAKTTQDPISADIVIVTGGSADQQEKVSALRTYFGDRTPLVDSNITVVDVSSTDVGTYQEAIAQASQTLATGPGKKVIICLSSDSELSGTIDNETLKESLTGIDYFFTVGTGAAKLQDAAPTGTITKTYSLTDSAEQISSSIFGTLRSVYCTNVVVEDTLSQYAEWSTGDKLQLNVTDKDGNNVEIGESIVTASYDEQTRKIVLQFPEEYHLTDQYTFSVTARIEPTEAAYQYYVENNSYEKGASGDPKTGDTSAKQPGFNVNQKATVTYAVGGEKKEPEEYAKPVIQLQTVYKWNLFKVSASETTDGNPLTLEGAEFELKTADTTQTYYGKSTGNGVAWYAREDRTGDEVTFFSAGTYTLKETKAPAGYMCSGLTWTVTIAKTNAITIKSEDDTEVSPQESWPAQDGKEITIVAKNEAANVGTPEIVSYAIYFEDNILYELPSAGGAGIFRFVVAGMLLMMSGALLIFAKRRKVLRI